MKAFEPFDVYPCTIDEDYVNLSVSIASLFGHLCLGSTFAHDKEMELLASERETSKRDVGDHDFQTMQSSEEGSIESHARRDLEHIPKRPRIRPSNLRDRRGDFLARSLATKVLTPKRNLPAVKKSCRSHIGQSKKSKLLPTPKSPEPLPNCVGGRTDSDRIRNDLLANNQVPAHCRTQIEPIELSDAAPSSQGNESGFESQVTVSDATFESQSLHDSRPNIKTMRLEQRKEAYKAAREPSGIWGIDHWLISSSGHHGEEEVEL